MSSPDVETIRGLIADWSRALEAKNTGHLLANYLPDVVLYDAIPPYKSVGVEAIRQIWEACMPSMPEKFESIHRDLHIEVSGDLAVAYGLHHMKPVQPPNHPCGNTWMRITVGFKRVGGQWKVAHEHVSVPFNPMNSTVWLISDPDRMDQPEWGKACKPEAT